MNMTAGDICREYRPAKDKAKQIEILADENRTNKDAIIKVLRDSGEDVILRNPKRQKEKKKENRQESQSQWQKPCMKS